MFYLSIRKAFGYISPNMIRALKRYPVIKMTLGLAVRQAYSPLINNAFVLASGIFLVLGAKTNVYVFILLGLVCIGMAFGGAPTITSAYINNEFGPANYPTNFSIANFSLVPAATLGPMISSALMESAGGRYDTSFYTMIGFALLGYLFLWLLDRKKRNK